MSVRKHHQLQNRLYLGELVKSFLGPSRRIKCLEDDGGNRYFRYASLLLEQLDVEHPDYQYIISVSQEFRKRFCAGAADDLLFYIHSWSRLAIHLHEMGIPLEVVTRDMRVTIDECIEHIDSEKMNVSECRKQFQFHHHKLSSCSDTDMRVDVNNDSILNDNEEIDQSIKEICITTCQDDVNLGNKDELKGENHVEIAIEIESGHHQHIKDVVNDNLTCDIDSKIKTSSKNEEPINVNKDGIEFIHLEMKNMVQDEDCDDTSWFFDGIEDDEEKGNGKVDSVIADPCKGCVDPGKKTGDTYNKKYISDSEENSDDSGAIITDIENLKRDIENDIERLTKSKQTFLKEKVCVATFNINNDQTDNNEFDSCFDESDSEFEVCFENNQDSDNRRTNMDAKYSKTTTDFEEENEFKTVAFEFTDIKLKENLIKEEKNDLSKNFVYSKPEENCSKVNEKKASTSSFDIELQTCSKDYSKVKEILEQSCINHDMVREKEKSVEPQISSSGTMEIVESKDASQNDDKKVVNKSSFEKLNKSILNSFHSNDLHQKKQDENSFQKDEMRKINCLLGSLGRENKKDSYKLNVSSLKFHSRHFQEEEIEELNETENYKVERNTGQLDSVGNNKNMGLSGGGTNSSSNKNSVPMKQNHDSSSDKLCTDHKPASLPDEDVVANMKQTPGSLNLERVDSMLREINNISKQNKTCDDQSIETKVCPFKSGNDLDISHFSKSSASNEYKSNDDYRTMHSIELKLDVSSLGKDLALKECKTRSISKPNVFLRSRHMNMESEISGTSNVLDTCEVNLNEPKTNRMEAKQIPDFDNNAIGQLIHGHREEAEKMEVEVRSLVYGVNHDGDESINKAVCDVILKQSKEGKLRLNMDFVDCHSNIGVGRGSPEVIDGVLVQTSVDNMMILQKFPGRQYRALLVNGDLTMTFKHKGYKPMKTKQFTSLDSFKYGKTELQCWLEEIIDTLKELSVNMLLVKGNISEDVVCVCEQHDIVTMETIRYKQLIQLSEATETDMVTYVTLATEENVCEGISIASLQNNWCNEMASSWRDKVAAVISLAENNPQTVILYGVSPEIVDLKEQELWNCLQHVSSVLHYGNVVLGAGQTEEKCGEFLNERLEILRRDEHSVTNIDLQYMQVVTESVMSSFQEYSRLFQDNFLGKRCAFEGFKSKIETLKLALETVAIVTNIDTYVETGITEERTNIGTL